MEEAFKVLGRLKHIFITKYNYALKHLLQTVSYRKEKIKRKEGQVFFCTPFRRGLFDFFEALWPSTFLSCRHALFSFVRSSCKYSPVQGDQRKPGVPLTQLARFKVWGWRFHTLVLTAGLAGAGIFFTLTEEWLHQSLAYNHDINLRLSNSLHSSLPPGLALCFTLCFSFNLCPSVVTWKGFRSSCSLFLLPLHFIDNSPSRHWSFHQCLRVLSTSSMLSSCSPVAWAEAEVYFLANTQYELSYPSSHLTTLATRKDNILQTLPLPFLQALIFSTK